MKFIAKFFKLRFRFISGFSILIQKLLQYDNLRLAFCIRPIICQENSGVDHFQINIQEIDFVWEVMLTNKFQSHGRNHNLNTLLILFFLSAVIDIFVITEFLIFDLMLIKCDIVIPFCDKSIH